MGGGLAGATIAAALAVLPLVFLLIQVRDVGLSTARSLVFRPLVGELLVNTLLLVVLVTSFSMVIGVGAAWLTERTDVAPRGPLSVLLVLPIAVPEYVNGFGWVSLFPGVHGLWGAVLVMTLSHYPLVYLPVAAVMRRGDPALEESARGLGLGPWRTFVRVTLPQLRLAVLGGGLVIALHLLAEYGGVAVLRFRTFTTEIYNAYKLGFGAQSAALLSLVLVLLCVLILTGDLFLGRRSEHGRATAARLRTRVVLGPWRVVASAAMGALVALALGVPLWSLAYWLIQGSSTTLPSASIVGVTWNTLGFGLVAALLATALAVPVALLAERRGGVLARILERTVYLPRALPGLVVGLALVFFSIRYATPLYQSRALLIVAYATLFLPLALVAVRPSVAQVTPGIEEAARSLGKRPAQVLWTVTLRMITPGLGAAAALVFLSSVTELTATLLLRPTGTETLATQFWLYTSGLAYGAAAPYAAVMVAISAIPTFLLIRRRGEDRGR
jgi:iron(III) transport system permease protein